MDKTVSLDTQTKIENSERAVKGDALSLSFFIPVYEWGPNPDLGAGTKLGTTVYDSVRDMYATEESLGCVVVGFMKLVGEVPTQKQFEKEFA